MRARSREALRKLAGITDPKKSLDGALQMLLGQADLSGQNGGVCGTRFAASRGGAPPGDGRHTQGRPSRRKRNVATLNGALSITLIDGGLKIRAQVVSTLRDQKKNKDILNIDIPVDAEIKVASRVRWSVRKGTRLGTRTLTLPVIDV